MRLVRVDREHERQLELRERDRGSTVEQRLPFTHELSTDLARARCRVQRDGNERAHAPGHLGEQRAGREPFREGVWENLIPGRDRVAQRRRHERRREC
jgi:hypothetical protein